MCKYWDSWDVSSHMLMSFSSLVTKIRCVNIRSGSHMYFKRGEMHEGGVIVVFAVTKRCS